MDTIKKSICMRKFLFGLWIVPALLGHFDQAVIDFGTITNSGNLASDEANSIKITFNVVVIENTEPDGSQLWITAGAEYYEGNEIWIGQTSYTYRTDTDPSNGTPSPSFEAASSSANTEIGKFGTFESQLKIEGRRIVNLSLIINRMY
ncbi:hypothetical protein BpHYR1_008573 [Brachionus plicatilis]|uniref:Uncharacterized protein n=1 Tax=Brachionus plicatilis TaxID=10195 RepID=A0A3M7QWE3_BRAPC|nr:hypothetical protein BpHYR1_008573 [Brachionus plicatilis]